MKLTTADKKIIEAIDLGRRGSDDFPSFIKSPKFDPLSDGIARRIKLNDVEEICRFGCLGGRIAWKQFLADPDGQYPALWHLCLTQFAINDSELLDAILKVPSRPRSERTEVTYPSFYYDLGELFFSITRSDASASERACKKVGTKKLTSSDAAEAACLIAIHNRDSTAFSNALNEHLKCLRRVRQINPEYKLINIVAIGLFAFAHYIDPTIVTQFDTNSPLPWDNEFWAYRCNGKQAIETIDHSQLTGDDRLKLKIHEFRDM